MTENQTLPSAVCVSWAVLLPGEGSHIWWLMSFSCGKQKIWCVLVSLWRAGHCFVPMATTLHTHSSQSSAGAPGWQIPLLMLQQNSTQQCNRMCNPLGRTRSQAGDPWIAAGEQNLMRVRKNMEKITPICSSSMGKSSFGFLKRSSM